MPKDQNFSHQTLDERMRVAPTDLIGTRWKHSGNGHVYKIVECCWLGEEDHWGLAHVREDNPVLCVRSVDNFFANRSNGDKRFEQVIIGEVS